jgi:replicative DNA helicase
MTEAVPMDPQERRHAEEVLLGSLFLHPELGVALRDQLRPEDFSEEPHRLIYEALATVLDSPTLVTVDVISTLLTADELAGVGGAPYLAFLCQQAESTTIPIEDQVQLLKRAALRALLDQAAQVLPALTGLSTGFADLDTVTGGLQRSDLVIVAGPPSIGKTSFALSIALHALLTEHCSVGVFSLEAPTRLVIRRLLAMEAELDEQLLRSVEAEEAEGQQPGEGSATLQVASLWIDDTANLSTTELSRKAHVLAERAGIQLLIVDYVHLMLSSVNDKRHENRVQEVGEISRSLKALARELDLPVLALAQVSRAFEGRPSKQLQLSDLRDGSLENDADLVLFLSVSEADTPSSANSPRLATISIAKHRHGPRADLDVCYLPASTRFCDLQTLPPVPERPATAPAPSSQRAKDFPRLQEIMARVTQGRQTPLETGSSPTIVPAQSSRSLPIGSVLEDEEA